MANTRTAKATSAMTARATNEPRDCFFFVAIKLPLDAVHGATGELRRVAEVALDAQQLIVLRDAVGAAGASGFDLAGVGRYREVGDERVFRFATAVRDDGLIAVHARHLDRLER